MSVVGSRVGTKAWSDGRQNEIQKSDKINSNSASDIQKLGGEDVGNVLNKIADPNYVDPSKKIRAVGSDKLDKDAFMKLMLAQMKNQDPTNPMKNHEMAAQLAQFSGLEQMQNMNTTLTEIQKGQKPAESFQALNFIGKSVSGDSAKVIRMKGDKDHEFAFTLPDAAQKIELKVRNQEGEIIRKVDLHDMKKGDNKWVWNGKMENGTTAPVGEYQFFIEAKTAAGKKLSVKTDFNGVISGVSYSAEGPVLLVGNQAVKLKDVKKIVDPSLKNNDQKLTMSSSPDLKSGQAASENEDKGAEEAPVTPANMLTNVGMSNGMMEKLKKETTPNAMIKPESKSDQRVEAQAKLSSETDKENAKDVDKVDVKEAVKESTVKKEEPKQVEL